MRVHDLVKLAAAAKPHTAPPAQPNRAQRRQMGFYARPVRLRSTHGARVDHRAPWQHPPVMVADVRNRALSKVGRKAA